MDQIIYKILTRHEWAAAEASGVYTGSQVDLDDGFIHFSSASQMRETATRHFAGQTDLVLLSVDPTGLPAGSLRWEPSRGGDLFPHLYETLDIARVTRVDPLPLVGGMHRFPEDLSC